MTELMQISINSAPASEWYWLLNTLSVWPLLLWTVLGMGLPWALLLLPRADWSRPAIVAGLSIAFGPAWLSAWMFVLGTIGAAQESTLLRFDLTLTGTLGIALMGTLLAWRKRQRSQGIRRNDAPLGFDEKLLLGLIVCALLIRLIVTAYWPFLAYDSLWVYAYQGRLFSLLGEIPQTIGYYPQFMQLQYSFLQLGFGQIDDHAARAVIPLMHLGSILAAYTLGAMLSSRRVGLILAAIWTLYPHVGDWARVGDLEIPLSFLFTLSSAFFLAAWHQPDKALRRSYALIAGLVFGIAMWTKPTAGAFVWGVLLLCVVDLLRLRLNWRAWWPRLETAIITGLACIPLGAVWYLRNALLGHPLLVFPHPSWLDLARRSGDLFGWPLLTLALLLLYLAWQKQEKPHQWRGIAVALLLIGLGLLPSMPFINAARFDPPASRILPWEWASAAIGLGLLIWTLRHRLLQASPAVLRSLTAQTLALPYFITWFYSYSYHPRLSFAIVPLMILPSAILIAALIPQSWRVKRRGLMLIVVGLLALPGLLIPWQNAAPESDWLWTDRYPDDIARYFVHNPELMLVKQELDAYIERSGQQPRIVAPGEQRLHFFYPLISIDEFFWPTRLDELDDATHYIYGTQAMWRYEELGVAPEDNQIVASLAREDIMKRMLRHTDSSFRYELYELNLDARQQSSADLGLYAPRQEVVFGEAIRFAGEAASARDFLRNRIFVEMRWEVLAELDTDYQVAIRLVNQDDGQTWYAWDGPVAQGEHAYYGTHLWQPGEWIRDLRGLEILDATGIPRSENYRLMIGFYDPETGDYLPLSIDGEASGELYPIFSPVYVGP